MSSEKNSSVLIAVREAPFHTTLRGDKPTEDASIIQFPAEYPQAVIVNKNVFKFDYAFNSSVTQSELYDTLIHPLVLRVLSGYDCTALAYGQTGTGKSYSMGMSVETKSEEHLGVLPRCLKEILECTSLSNQQKENNLPPKTVLASYIEIYNEKAYDLLAADTNKPLASRGQRRFTGGTCQPLRNQEDLQQLLLRGTKNRHVRRTNMNGNSSRSHAIVTIHIKQAHRHSRLNIVDLAGSEGLRRTGNEGMARAEGVYINMGLLGINKVLLSMSAGHTVIPYRDTILTTVLQESLSAGAYLTLLACVSPHASDLSETNSTLHFANNAKHVKLTPRLSQQMQQLQLQVRSGRKKSINATPQSFRRVLPSSTAIKRTVNIRSLGAISNSFSTPTKPAAATAKVLQRHHSDMGLTPKAKERTRVLLELPLNVPPEQKPDLSPVVEQAECSLTLTDVQTPIAVPTLSDYMLLKNKYDALQQKQQQQQQQQQLIDKLEEQQLPNDAERQPSLSLLSYSDFNTELCSIAEENDQISVARCQLFSSSPTSFADRRLSSLTRISGIAHLSPTPVAKTELEPTKFVRRSVRLMGRPLSRETINQNVPTQMLPRRTMRMSSQADAKATRPSEQVELLSMQLGRGTKNARLRKHRSNLLGLLNAASVKELQALPCIGPKTAITLIMHRSLLGNFKNWQQVQKLPIWKGQSWSRFATANCIEISQ